MRLFKEELKKVEAFAFDVDGVFSRHEMNITPEGDLIRTSCTKDGYAMMYCTKKGYPVCIISGGQAPGVRERFEKLGVKDVYLGVANKVEPYLADVLGEKVHFMAKDAFQTAERGSELPQGRQHRL